LPGILAALSRNAGDRAATTIAAPPCDLMMSAQMLSQPDKRPSVVRRMTAGQMLLEGATDEEVADRLHISKHTVKRYRSIIDAGGLEALEALGVGGRVSVLDEQALAWLASALNDSARVYGFESDAWTNARLRALIERRFGVKFSRVYVWQLATKLGLGHILSKSRR
jgi:transposase